MGILDVSLGPLLVGVTLNIGLYGVTLMQTFEYYRNCGGDSSRIKSVVTVLFIADTLNSVFGAMDIYKRFVVDFGDFKAIAKGTWMGSTQPIMTAIISSIVQLFLADRVRRLTGRTWIFILIVATTLTQAAGGIATTIRYALARGLTDLSVLKVEGSIWLVFAAVTDILIAGSLVLYLSRSRTGFAATDDLISRIIRTTVQTGLITTIWATVALILYLTLDNNLHLIFNYPLCKLYTNSLMSTLNSRSRWESTSKSSHSARPSRFPARRDNTSFGQVSVQVHQTIDVTEDIDPIPLAPRTSHSKIVEFDPSPSPSMKYFDSRSDGVAEEEDKKDKKLPWANAV